jgi:circadian clock protein KaiB
MKRPALLKFRLYVAGEAPNSTQARANLAALCRPYQCQIEVIDVFRDPKRALADGIFMTPTLVRVFPLPIRKVVGSLSHAQPVLQALGLEDLAA